MTTKIFLAGFSILCFMKSNAQQKAKPEDTEFYTPVPKVIDPGKPDCGVPSDAIVLFDGTNLDKWRSSNDSTKAAGWNLVNGIMKVNKQAGDIQTKQNFLDYQLHLEWRVP